MGVLVADTEASASGRPSRLGAVRVLMFAFVVAMCCTGATAHAATFSNAVPESGSVQVKSQSVQFSVDAVAAPGQTLSPSASIRIDGGAPVSASVNYAITGYEWTLIDPDYDYWDWAPIYDYTRATVRATVLLPSSISAHAAALTVTEQPSAQTYTFTWDFPVESCKSCHVGYPGSHDPAILSSCWDCHTTSGPVLRHNGGCSGCHGGGHGIDRLQAHTYYDLDGNPYDREERTCSSCHAGGYVGITQISGVHGDPTAAHAPAVSPECAECHGSDLAGLHAGCDSCHGSLPISGETCASCHSSIEPDGHGFPIYNKVYNPNHSGYLAWSYVVSETGATGSPHGNYTTTTTKCAVCHAVHRADPAGVVLTAWGGTGTAVPAFSPTMAPFESCFFCHGNGATFTDRTVEFFVTSSGVLSPHTTCGRCHTASPHGAGGSEYEILASKLLNEHADGQLAADLSTGNNGLTAAMFDLTDANLYGQGLTLGTGYLCVGCHGNAANEHVFAVNERGATPAVHYGPDGALGSSGVTGHQVWVEATNTWSNPGTWFSGGGAHDYYLATYRYKFGETWRHFKVASATTFNEVQPDGETPLPGGLTGATTAQIIAAYGTWDSTIAWNSALGCAACHDAKRTGGKLAFPHGYVNAAGAPAPKWSHAAEGIMDPDGYLQTSFLWMTIAGDADDARILMRTRGNNNIDANLDGACLKCHLSGDRTEGIGSNMVFPPWVAPDTTPPVTTSNAAGPYTGSATITLSATDTGGSGVANTYYTVNGGAQQTGTTIALSSPGTYVLSFWSVDGAGNAETPNTATVVVNAAMGTITIDWGAPLGPGESMIWTVRSGGPAGAIVAQGPPPMWNSSGVVVIPVQVSATPYHVYVYWNTPDDGGEVENFPVSITSAGQNWNFTW